MISLTAGREHILLVTVVIFAIILYLMEIEGVRHNKIFTIKKLPAIDAADEAVGRAVEMGRPILFHPGSASLNTMDAPSTLAGLSILNYVADLAASKGARIIAVTERPEIYPLEHEIVREAFIAHNKEDQFVEDDIKFIPALKAVVGLMNREHVAANFLIGRYYHESLVLVEAGAQVGAMQIGGISQISQVPFMMACCDYCLLGEEVFAASAYVSKDPVLTCSIAGQDYVKMILMALMIVGAILTSMNIPQFLEFFK